MAKKKEKKSSKKSSTPKMPMSRKDMGKMMDKKRGGKY